jgi:hypothetical protein
LRHWAIGRLLKAGLSDPKRLEALLLRYSANLNNTRRESISASVDGKIISFILLIDDNILLQVVGL